MYFVSEPVQHQGGVVADVMANSIATSTYSQAETFLRETLQNACDQKKNDLSQIEFVIDLFQVGGEKKKLLDDFFSEARLGQDPLGFTKLKNTKTFEAIVAWLGLLTLPSMKLPQTLRVSSLMLVAKVQTVVAEEVLV